MPPRPLLLFINNTFHFSFSNHSQIAQLMYDYLIELLKWVPTSLCGGNRYHTKPSKRLYSDSEHVHGFQPLIAHYHYVLDYRQNYILYYSFNYLHN